MGDGSGINEESRSLNFKRDLRLLLRVRVRSFINSARFSGTTARRIGIGLFVGAVVLFVFVFFAFTALLRAVQAQAPQAAPALIEQTHFWVFLFLLAGGVPFVSGVLFAPSDEALLLANAPASPAAFVVARLIDAVLAASSQFLVLGVPLLLACASALSLPFWAWPIFTLVVVLQITLPALLVAALLLGCARVIGVRRVKGAVALTSALLAVALCLLSVGAISQQANHGLTLSSFASAASAASHSVSPAAADLLPSFWAAHALTALASSNSTEAVKTIGLLLGACVLLGTACVQWGKHVLRGDLFTNDTSGRKGKGWEEGLARLPGLSPQVRGLLVKDARYVSRDLVLWSQIGTPLILYFVPFIIGAQLKAGGSTTGTGNGDLMLLCAGVVGTIAYMETSILGLSSLGLEGRGFWLVLSAPVSAGQLLRAKWSGAFAASVLVCVPLWILACAIYTAGAAAMLTGAGLIIVACAALCGLAVGVSGIFPRFVYENPAHRASVSALVWGFVFASGYVLIAGAFLGLGWFGASQWPERGVLFWCVGGGLFALLSVAALFIPLFLAQKRLDVLAWEG